MQSEKADVDVGISILGIGSNECKKALVLEFHKTELKRDIRAEKRQVANYWESGHVGLAL